MGNRRDQPPEEPFAQFEGYPRFINILPDSANARVGRYVDPLTGERRQFRYDNLVVFAELHHLQEYLGHVPTSSDLKEHGEISLSVYHDRFGSYPRSLEVAGFDPVFADVQEKAQYLREYVELVDPEHWQRFHQQRPATVSPLGVSEELLVSPEANNRSHGTGRQTP